MTQPLAPSHASLKVAGALAVTLGAIATLQGYENQRYANAETTQLVAQQAERIGKLPQQCAGRKLTAYEASLSSVLTPCGKVAQAQQERAFGNQVAFNRTSR